MKLLVRHSRAQPHALPHARSRLRWVSVVLAGLGVAASIWVLQPEKGDVLRSAQPDLSAHVGRAPDQVRLDFAHSPDPRSQAEVVVLSPEDKNLARGPASTGPDGISQPVAGLSARGAYQVVYEVPLVDGSVASGQYWFWYAPSATGSSSRLQSPALLGLLLAAAVALATALLTPGRARKSAVHVPAQRAGSPATPTSTPPVPAQRSRHHHEGLSPPASPRPGSAPVEPRKSVPPRQP